MACRGRGRARRSPSGPKRAGGRRGGARQAPDARDDVVAGPAAGLSRRSRPLRLRVRRRAGCAAGCAASGAASGAAGGAAPSGVGTGACAPAARRRRKRRHGQRRPRRCLVVLVGSASPAYAARLRRSRRHLNVAGPDLAQPESSLMRHAGVGASATNSTSRSGGCRVLPTRLQRPVLAAKQLGGCGRRWACVAGPYRTRTPAEDRR